MNIIGIDPSSSKSGVSLIKNGKITEVSCWFRTKKLDHSQNLKLFGEFLDRFKGRRKIDVVAVEEMSVSRNVTTVRVVSYFEGLALLKAAEWNAKALSLKPSQARKKAFGSDIGKEKAYKQMKKQFKLLPYDSGGNDMSDAMVLAKAGWKYTKG